VPTYTTDYYSDYRTYKLVHELYRVGTTDPVTAVVLAVYVLLAFLFVVLLVGVARIDRQVSVLRSRVVELELGLGELESVLKDLYTRLDELRHYLEEARRRPGRVGEG